MKTALDILPDLLLMADEAHSLCISQIDFGPAIDIWLKTNYPQPCCTIGSIRSHKAQLYITNLNKPLHCFDCNAVWCLFLGLCWLFSAPCYKVSDLVL